MAAFKTEAHLAVGSRWKNYRRRGKAPSSRIVRRELPDDESVPKQSPSVLDGFCVNEVVMSNRQESGHSIYFTRLHPAKEQPLAARSRERARAWPRIKRTSLFARYPCFRITESAEYLRHTAASRIYCSCNPRWPHHGSEKSNGKRIFTVYTLPRMRLEVMAWNGFVSG